MIVKVIITLLIMSSVKLTIGKHLKGVSYNFRAHADPNFTSISDSLNEHHGCVATDDTGTFVDGLSSTNSILTYDEDEKNFSAQGLFAIAYDGVHEDDCLPSDDYRFIMALPEISQSLHTRKPFDISRPCAICGKTGHTFQDCDTINNENCRQRLLKLYFAAKRFCDVNSRIFDPASTSTNSLKTMKTFPLCQVIELDKTFGAPPSVPVHTVQAQAPAPTTSTPKTSSRVKATMNVVANHSSQS